MGKFDLKGGVWSATPTPFTDDFRLDVASVRRLVRRHLDMGVAGIMLAGTCGEGPWMSDGVREALTREASQATEGRIPIVVQVTDNSAVRVLDNIERAAKWGAEIAMVAAPYVTLNLSSARLLDHYREIARRSPLPIGVYDGGGTHVVREADFPTLLAEPNIVLVKDSSASDTRRASYVAARAARPELLLLNGDEFNCVPYIQSGYDGVLLGGAIFNGFMAAEIIRLARQGNLAAADKLQARMNDLMYVVYGGTSIECWLAGLKEILVRMELFSTRKNLLGYALTDHCRDQIQAATRGTDGLGYQADLNGSAFSAGRR